MLMSREHKKLLLKHRVVLVNNMDTESVLNELQAKSILTSRHADMIRSQPVRFRMNEALLDSLATEATFQAFIEALRNTEQHHLVNELGLGWYP
jgi:hypothetical protein